MRQAARLLLIESVALRSALESVPVADLDRPTVCTGWSVRDVIAHCAAALRATASGELHDFSPETNQRDVDARSGWDIERLLAELHEGYAEAAVAIDAAGGSLDGVGLGEWIHGGDIRDALDLQEAYVSDGVEMAVQLLVDRSAIQHRRGIVARIGDDLHHLGRDDDMRARLVTDVETFVRLCSGRAPDPARFSLTGADPADLVLFT